jgi:hypothetical protein
LFWNLNCVRSRAKQLRFSIMSFPCCFLTLVYKLISFLLAAAVTSAQVSTDGNWIFLLMKNITSPAFQLRHPHTNFSRWQQAIAFFATFLQLCVDECAACSHQLGACSWRSAVANLGPRSCLWGKRLGRGEAPYFELRSINYSVAWVLPEQLSRCSAALSLSLLLSLALPAEAESAADPDA